MRRVLRLIGTWGEGGTIRCCEDDLVILVRGGSGAGTGSREADLRRRRGGERGGGAS